MAKWAEIAASVLPGVLEAFRAAGFDPVDIAERAHIGLEDAHNSPPTLPLRDFVRMLELAGAASESTGFLWRCGRRWAAQNFEQQFPFASDALRLGDALRLVALHLRLLQSDSVFRLEVRDGLALFEYRVLDPSIWPRARDVEFTFGVVAGMVSRFVGDDFRPESLVFEHAPDARTGRIDNSVGLACVHGEATNLFVLPASLLSRRGPGTDGPRTEPSTASALLTHAIAEREQSADLPLRVRRAVFSLIGSGVAIDQGSVAQACGLSTRSLRRHLLASGRSFRDEIGRLRMEYARAAIVHTTLPMGEIARRLGYNEQSAFTRAFRRGLGVAPTRVRQQASAAPG